MYFFFLLLAITFWFVFILKGNSIILSEQNIERNVFIILSLSKRNKANMGATNCPLPLCTLYFGENNLYFITRKWYCHIGSILVQYTLREESNNVILTQHKLYHGVSAWKIELLKAARWWRHERGGCCRRLANLIRARRALLSCDLPACLPLPACLLVKAMKRIQTTQPRTKFHS